MTNFPALPNPYGLRRVSRVDVSQNLLGNLTIQRIWWNRVVQHAWQFPWPALTDTQRIALEAFFATCRGRILGDIAYTCPFDSVEYTCRLDVDENIINNSPMPIYSGSLNLVECTAFKALKAPVNAFPAVPFQAYSRANKYNTVVEAQQNSTELRYEDWNAPIKRWTVGGKALTLAQATTLLDAWEGNGGPFHQFTFTDPLGSTAYDAHFVETEAVITFVTYGVFSLLLTVEELK